MITFGHVIDFILKNKGKVCYKGATRQEIEKDVWQAWHDNCFYYETDEHNNLVGWLQYEVHEDKKEVFVYQNIAMSLDRLCRFLIKFFEMYPNYKLVSRRHGRFVHYNKHKLLTKLKSHVR
jgi:hypothetical protein